MKASLFTLLGTSLLILALAFYSYGIIEAIRVSWEPGPLNGVLDDRMSTGVGFLQGLLLTNFGVLLGISISRPRSALSWQLMMVKQATPTREGWHGPLTWSERVQLVGLIVYLLSLVACLLAWVVEDFSSDPRDIVPVVAFSGKMCIGVLLAYALAVVRR